MKLCNNTGIENCQSSVLGSYIAFYGSADKSVQTEFLSIKPTIYLPQFWRQIAPVKAAE